MNGVFFLYSVVVIEDEYWTLKGIVETFPFAKYEMEVKETFTDPAAALDYIVQNQPDIIITDIEMPDIHGILLIKKLRERMVRSKILVLSAHSNFTYAQELIRLGIFEYCLKPINRQDADLILNRLHFSLDSKTEIVTESNITESRSTNSRFSRIVQYINEHYADKLSLNDLCKSFGLNQDYCNTLFQKHYGCTYSYYLKSVRMEKACYLLRQNVSISDVAVQTGYSDYFYFNKVFKSYYGITPYQYKCTN